MMNSWLTYVFEINLYLLLFAVAYHLLFKNLTFFNANRFLIIGLVFSAFIIPFIPVSSEYLNDSLFTIQLEELIVGATNDMSSQPSGFNLMQFLGAIYFLGAAATALFLLFQMALTYKLVHISRKTRSQNGTEVWSSNQRSTASFFHYLFWSCEPESEHIPWIRAHEAVHMRELHSVDVIFIRLARIFCWFNPAIYLLEKAMETNHEFCADQAVIKKFDDKSKYSRILLSEAFGISEKILAHHFAKSNLLKSRIMMLNRSKSKNSSVAKYLLLIPLLAAGIIFHACTEEKSDVTQPAGAPIVMKTAEAPEMGEKIPVTDVYKVVETMPEYPGGNEALMSFLGENIVYPSDAKAEGIEGTVYIQFIINIDGSVRDLESLNPRSDQRLVEAAFAVISQMPDWKPGEHEGQKVKVQYVLPINYRLN